MFDNFCQIIEVNGETVEYNSNEEIGDILSHDELPLSITFRLPSDQNIITASDPKFRFVHMEERESLVEEYGREYRRELLDYFVRVRPLTNVFVKPLVGKIFL